ncbi:nad kinase [Anaeramoeba flamelloides]|uniref:Nad kinase n=1 Tax=Anaeramoeba flamelloides TaxID=1746091 RepID=A0ABQ8XTA6_9EUKA|nr:nad kinase [Anaeramoeba flamelloides]
MKETKKFHKQPNFQNGSFSKILQEAKFDKKILVSHKENKKDPLTNWKIPLKAITNKTNSESNYRSEPETQSSYTSSSFSSYTSSSESSWDSFSSSGTESKTSDKSDSLGTPNSTGSTSSTETTDTTGSTDSTGSTHTNSEDSHEESKIISSKLTRLQTKRKHVFSRSQVFFPKKIGLKRNYSYYGQQTKARIRLMRSQSTDIEPLSNFLAKKRHLVEPLVNTRDLKVKWSSKPKTVLIVKKPNNSLITTVMKKIVNYLMFDLKINVIIESSIKKEFPDLPFFKKDYREFKKIIKLTLEKNILINFRSRLLCKVYSADGDLLLEKNVTNEVVIDRGSNSISFLKCYCDGVQFTIFTGDGVMVTTPTGSTAYNLSAGGAITHPSVKGMLFTPMCPYSISARPLLFPNSVTLKIKNPKSAKCNVSVTFDGSKFDDLQYGGYVTIQTYKYPIPSIHVSDSVSDWFSAISSILGWNEVTYQPKPYEED